MSKLYLIESVLVLRKRAVFPAAFASETAGSRTTERELVKVDGKSIKGSTMPFKMPNKRSASMSDRPLVFKRYGTSTASKLCSILMMRRFADNGKESEHNCFMRDFFEVIWLLFCVKAVEVDIRAEQCLVEKDGA